MTKIDFPKIFWYNILIEEVEDASEGRIRALIENDNYCGGFDEELDESDIESIEDKELEEDVKAEENPGYIKMDFSLETPEERTKKVEEIIANTPPERLTPKYLEKLADYIIFAMDKEERKQKRYLTENRMVTVNKRETSFEGLVGKLENGEDGIYNMIANDKNIIFQPKVSITEEDIATIPGLKNLRDSIAQVEEAAKHARGKKAYLLKKQLIEMRQDQYVLKNAYKSPMYCMNPIKSMSKLDLEDHITIDEFGNIHNDAIISFFDEKHISAILCNYSKLKQDSWDKLNSDAKWMMEDFDELTDAALKDKYPMYYDLMIYKIDGKQNIEIQELLFEKYGIKHSVEYISSLWRNKIPKLIVEQAINDYLVWYFTFKEKGKWKKCSRCGQIKLAHNNFFSKNKTSKDGYYSICKCCRNKKK